MRGVHTMQLATAVVLSTLVWLEGPLRLSPYTVWALSVPLLLWCAAPVHAGLWRSVRVLRADADMLVSLSIWSAFLYSTAAVFLPEHLPSALRVHFLGAMAALVLLTALGRWVERRLTGAGGEALGRLSRRIPHTARLLRGDSAVVVPVADVSAGDRVRILPGEQIPFDGEVEEGGSSVDESIWTGSQRPVEKSAGGKVYAGTQNKSGGLTVKVARAGRDTELARLVESVTRGLELKSGLEGTADRWAGTYVPVVVIAAVAVALLWSWMGPEPRQVHALASLLLVLIAACPWPLSLAAPAAVAAGIRRAHRKGIRIRNPGLMRRLGLPDVVVLSKTGLTDEDGLEVAEVSALGGWDGRELLRLAASAESRSEHPVARALRRRNGDAGTAEPSSAETYPGRGVAAEVEGRRVLVGGLEWLAERGVGTPEDVRERLRSSPQPASGVAVDGSLAGVVLFDERLRPGSEEVVRLLERMGVKVMLVSMDRGASAHHAAAQAGIGKVEAEAPGETKVELIKRLRSTGKTVAMVGDGVLDASAISWADLGVALRPSAGSNGGPRRPLGAGIDLTAEAADMVLQRSGLEGLAEGMRILSRIRLTVRENLLWSFGVHLLLMPLAAGLFLQPWGAALRPGYLFGAAALSLTAVAVHTIRRFKW